MVSYAQLTFSDPNPLKRWLQRGRLRHSIRLAQSLSDPRYIVDFGAGNGELCKLLRGKYPHARMVCYEPVEIYRNEARENLASLANVEFLATPGGIADVDIVFCLEVLEHLPPKQLAD